MKKILKQIMAIACAMMLTNGALAPVTGMAAAYVPTCQLKDYYPFDDEKEEVEQVKTKAPEEMTFKEKLAAKRELEKKATASKTTEITNVKKGNLYIPAGQKISVELMEKVSSKGFKAGDLVKIKVKDNLMLNDTVVIAKDSEGTAFIYEARKAGGMGRKGKLKVAGNELHTVNGIPVPLRNGLVGHGKTDGGAGVVLAAVSMVGGIFMKGTNINYPAGTIFEVEVRENVDLNCTADNLAEAMSSTKPVGVQIIIP